MAINLKNYEPALMAGADIEITSADFSIDDLTVVDDAAIGGDLAVTGTLTQTGAAAFTVAPTGPQKRTTVASSAAVGATVVLTAAQSGGVFINASTSGSPSWTMPTNAAGLYYTFVCANATAGFTLTGGTFKALTNPGGTGTAITGTTLTHTQGTADIGDSITFVADGTNWVAVSQAGIFAAA
jgi:hypothetical protein